MFECGVNCDLTPFVKLLSLSLPIVDLTAFKVFELHSRTEFTDFGIGLYSLVANQLCGWFFGFYDLGWISHSHR